MLKFYLSTVIIWVIVIYALCFLCEKNIITNGWTSKEEYCGSTSHGCVILFFVSAIPIIRLLFAICILMMATYDEETLCELVGVDKDDTE